MGEDAALWNWDNPCFECCHEESGDCPDNCPVLETLKSHCAEHGDFEGTTCQGCVKKYNLF